jgi:hypothetical protein
VRGLTKGVRSEGAIANRYGIADSTICSSSPTQSSTGAIERYGWKPALAQAAGVRAPRVIGLSQVRRARGYAPAVTGRRLTRVLFWLSARVLFWLSAGATGLSILQLSLTAIGVKGWWTLLGSPRSALGVAAFACLSTMVNALCAYEVNRVDRSRASARRSAGRLVPDADPSASEAELADPPVCSTAYWTQLSEAHWRAVITTGFSVAVMCLAPWLKMQWELHEKQNDQMRATADSWSKLRASLISYAAACPAPGDACASLRQRVTEAYVEATWVVPLFMHDIRATCAMDKPPECPKASEKPLDPKQQIECEYHNACDLLRGPFGMSKASHSFREFLTAATLDANADIVAARKVRAAFNHCVTETRILGCAILFARNHQVRGDSGDEEQLASCWCRNKLLRDAFPKNDSADPCRQEEYGMTDAGDEMSSITELMQKRCLKTCSERGQADCAASCADTPDSAQVMACLADQPSP